jgi:hypothetical protein
MEAIAVYAVLAWLGAVAGEGGKPGLLAVLLVVGGSFGLARALQSTELPLELVRAWGTAASLLVFYAIVRVDYFGDWQFWDFTWADRLFGDLGSVTDSEGAAVLTVPLLWLVWLRGLTRGQEPQGFDSILRTFVAGLIAVTIVSVFEGSVDDTPGLVGKLAVPYVMVGLIGIALAHAAQSEGDSGRGFGGVWLAAIGGGVLLMAGISLLVALFDIGNTSDAAGDGGNAVWDVIGPAVEAAATPLIDALDAAIRGLRDLFTALFGEPNLEDNQGRPEPIPPDELEWNFPGWVDLILRAVITTTVILVVVAVLALTFRRFRKTVRPTHSRESVYEQGRIAADLGGLLGGLIDRFRPGGHRRAYLDPIRRLYHEMLAEAAHRGAPRPEHVTPIEFAAVLEERFRSPLPGRISTVFAAARYGGHVADTRVVDGLREEWQALAKSGQTG